MDALLNRIVQLCKGDKKKANHLIETAQAKHPGNIALWYLQKVISELEQQQAEYYRKRRLPTAQPPQTTSSQVNWSQAEQQLKQRLHKTSTVAKAKPTQPVSSKVQSQLFTLVNGEMETAKRLLEHTRQVNPMQTEQWVWEKVIFDLERDRR
ncbi:MAG: hypothetical protein KME45_11560 [Stenomitos rutilans HA7619-LM2]|jgi:pyruvate kinase|nr:hypothetical protein [Stenomitos rutilans HA7619-LM2]